MQVRGCEQHQDALHLIKVESGVWRWRYCSICGWGAKVPAQVAVRAACACQPVREPHEWPYHGALHCSEMLIPPFCGMSVTGYKAVSTVCAAVRVQASETVANGSAAPARVAVARKLEFRKGFRNVLGRAVLTSVQGQHSLATLSLLGLQQQA